MSKFSYFKVNEDILSIDIKKSELWVYLTHCRHRGRNTSYYSIASLNAVQNHFGNSIKRKLYDKCIKSLQDKGLINEVDIKENEIFKGYFKVGKAIEIIEGKINIQIPTELLDNKIITNLKVDEIKDIIKLYSLYEPLKSFGGLDYDVIHAVNKDFKRGVREAFTFGDGFSRAIYEKQAYEIEPPTKYILDDFNIDMNKYIKMKLFRFKPVILEYDSDDEDLTELRYEIFDNLVSTKEKKYKYITTLEENQRAIYVIEPIYPVKNPKYKEYLKNRAKARTKAIEIYFDEDKGTDREEIFNLVCDNSIRYFIEDNLMNREDIPVNTILNLIDEFEELALNNHLILVEGKEEKELLSYWIDEEIEAIKDYNINKSKSTGKRSRITTTKRLKALEKKYNNLDITLKAIDNILDDLIALIPKWIVSQITEYQNELIE